MKINKIYILNNKKHEHRLRLTLEQLQANRKIVYTSRAIYPSEIKVAFRSKFNTLKDGELGCLLSHRMLWKKIICENSDQYYIIVEDDILLNVQSDLISEVTAITDAMDSVADILFLGSFDGRVKLKRSKKKKIIIGERQYFVGEPLPRSVWCTYGYMINIIGARKLLYATRKGAWPVDHFYKYISETNKISSADYYALIPNVIIPRGEPSTIQGGNNSLLSVIKKNYVNVKNAIYAYFS